MVAGDTSESEAVASLVRLGCTEQMANKLVKNTNASGDDGEDDDDDDVTFVESVHLYCSEEATVARKQFNGLRLLFQGLDRDEVGYVTLGQLQEVLAQLYSPEEPPMELQVALTRSIQGLEMQVASRFTTSAAASFSPSDCGLVALSSSSCFSAAAALSMLCLCGITAAATPSMLTSRH